MDSKFTKRHAPISDIYSDESLTASQSQSKSSVTPKKPLYIDHLKHALLYSFIVFKYVILILRKDKYILGRIGLYFWGFGEKRNLF